LRAFHSGFTGAVERLLAALDDRNETIGFPVLEAQGRRRRTTMIVGLNELAQEDCGIERKIGAVTTGQLVLGS
jgi:hypothetical protein